jgi:hypothetical protein
MECDALRLLMNTGLPIPIPPLARTPNEWLNRHLNSIRDSLIRLRDRKPPTQKRRPKYRRKNPFEGRVTDTDEITIGPGRCRCLDLAGPAEMLDILKAETAVGSLTGSGTIWAYVPGTFAQIENKTGTIPDHNHSLAVGDDGEATLTLKTYRWLTETGIYSYTTSPPSFGSYWSSGDPHVYVPILDFETVSGQVAITAQRVVDDIFVTDSYCTITVS